MDKRKVTVKQLQQQLTEAQQEIRRLHDENLNLQSERNTDSTAGISVVGQNEPNVSCIEGMANNSSSVLVNGQSFTMGIQEISVLIPEFDPQKHKALSAETWLNNIDKLKLNYGWDEKSCLFYASLRLSGAARFWFASTQGEMQTWEAFKKQMNKSFPQSKDDGDTLLKIMTRKKHRDECIENYFYEVLSLGKQIKLSDESITRFIISGLDNDNLKSCLLSTNFSEHSELLKQIKKFEEMESQIKNRNKLSGINNYHRREYDNNKRQRQYAPYPNKNFNRNSNQFQNFKNYNYRNTNENKPIEKKCFICNDRKHLANNCPRRLRLCFNCQKEGHFARDCKEKKISSINKLHEIYPQDEYHPKVKLGNVEFTAFIDLGSCCTTVKQSIAKMNNWLIEPCDMVLRGFGGSLVKPVGKIKNTLEVNGNCFDIDIVVVDDEAQEVPIIIGRTITDRPDVRVIKSLGRIDIQKLQVMTIQENFMDIQKSDICINEAIDDNVVETVLALLNKYRGALALNPDEVGKTSLIEMKIELKENKVINYRPYKVAYGLKETLQNNIDDLLKLGVIRHSSSEYASPVLLVPKKNGEQRMCVDFRKLNAISKKENFPVPNIEETLNSLSQKKYFTSLDMMSGYYQIPIQESSKHLTAFVTPDGHYEFNCMPFGLTNAPAVFMRLMRKLRDNIKITDSIVVYMDDVLIATETITEHIEALEEILQIFLKANLTLNLSKCSFLQTKISFLGHEISFEGIKPGSIKIAVVENYEKPKTNKEVRQFLGLCGYFRRFVKGFANIARPLYNLLKKESSFIWNDEHEKAFEELKKILVTRPVLALYRVDLEHEVHTDASSHGLAGILMQKHKNGEINPVSYFSRTTTEAESRYHSYELEALAVVESLQRFRHYLLNKHFKVITDCNSLRLTQEKKNLIPRIARWWLKLSEYDYELIYRNNKQMAHVDALSRSPYESGEESGTVAEKMLIIGVDKFDWLASLQQQDPWIVEIREVLDGTAKDVNKDKFSNYTLKDGRVFKITEKGEKFIVPKGVHWRVIKMVHDDMGHAGLDRTIDYIRKYFWFPSLKHIVRKYINSCIDCAYNKRGKDETNYQLHVVNRQPVPFFTIHLDHLGPFPKSKSGNMYIIGLICTFTKFIVIKAVKNTSTLPVIRMLNEVTQYFGIPTVIITDRGSAFMAKEFQKYCYENSVKHVATAVQTPRANGQIERYFRTITPAIAAMTKEFDGTDWDKNLTAIQWGLNSFKQTTTGQSPQELLMGYTPKSILKNKLLLAVQENASGSQSEDDIPLSELREIIRKKMQEKQNKHAEKFNKKNKSPLKYECGDLVLIRQQGVATGQPRKAQPRYKGPYQVKAVLENDRYVITDTMNIQLSQKPYESVHSADRMKPWCKLKELDFDDTELEDENADPEVN